MNIRIVKRVFLASVLGASLSLATAVESIASEKTKQKTAKQIPIPAGDAFTLTLSTVPYSSDPNSDYVRIYCAPGKKHTKSN